MENDFVCTICTSIRTHPTHNIVGGNKRKIWTVIAEFNFNWVADQNIHCLRGVCEFSQKGQVALRFGLSLSSKTFIGNLQKGELPLGFLFLIFLMDEVILHLKTGCFVSRGRRAHCSLISF